MTAASATPGTSQGIGHEAEEVRATLLDATQTLAQLGDEAVAERLHPIQNDLESYMARVAIVGQIKAGKSTLANCLTGRSGLLPSDINPWTSVVTRLYFDHPSGKTSGARFHFYDEAKWERLAKRGGKLGELTEGLLEDYKREELFAQVNAMRDRAKLRLGDSFERLLGKSHRFETISTEVIERYACAGDEPEERLTNPAAGRYNDITHTAELFFDRAPFGCPVCLIDTPGTNDPLLIREEVTQQNLETADYFVVVLSAHQALSESDLSLVRILRALKRNRIVAFVNRIDEINNLADDFEDLRTRVARRLRRELGGVDVPVILGSASWAASLLPEGGEVDEALVGRIADIKRNRPDIAALAPSGDTEAPDIQLASGLLELQAALSGQIFDGAATALFRPAAEDLYALAWQTAETASQPAGAPEPSVNLSPVAVKAVLNQLEEQTTTARAQLHAKAEAIWAEVAQQLQDCVLLFAEEQTEKLLDDIDGSLFTASISLDVEDLREKLKSLYSRGFGQVQHEFWVGLRALNSARTDLLDPAVAKRLPCLQVGTLSLLSVDARVSVLYRAVTLDFASNWLSTLFTRRSARVEDAIASVTDQFDEICTELLTRGTTELQEQVEKSLDRYVFDMTRLGSKLLKELDRENRAAAEETIPPQRDETHTKQAEELVERLTTLRERLEDDAEKIVINA